MAKKEEKVVDATQKEKPAVDNTVEKNINLGAERKLGKKYVKSN